MRKQICLIVILVVASIALYVSFSNNLPSAPAMVQEFMKATETVTGDKAIKCNVRLRETLNGTAKVYHTVTFEKKLNRCKVVAVNGKSVKLSSGTAMQYTNEVVLSYDKNEKLVQYSAWDDMGNLLISRPVK